MRRYVVVALGALGLVAALALSARAEITDPSDPTSGAYNVSPVQPVSKASPAPATPAPAVPNPVVEPSPALVEVPVATPARIPASEHVVKRSRVTKSQNRQVASDQGGAVALEQVAAAVSSGAHHVGVFLDEVASACKVGLAQGVGGPIPVLAVLSMAFALERRRILGVRGVSDEEVPQLLYAGDVIAPG